MAEEVRGRAARTLLPPLGAQITTTITAAACTLTDPHGIGPLLAPRSWPAAGPVPQIIMPFEARARASTRLSTCRDRRCYDRRRWHRTAGRRWAPDGTTAARTIAVNGAGPI